MGVSEKMTYELWEKRIGWATEAFTVCLHSKSEWGIRYWSGVISKLEEMKPITYH